MSDYELDPIDPRDPEYEYAPPSWQKKQEGSYRTGSMTPPKEIAMQASEKVYIILWIPPRWSRVSTISTPVEAV